MAARYLQSVGFDQIDDRHFKNSNGHRLDYDRQHDLWTERDSAANWVASYFLTEGNLEEGIEMLAETWAMLREPARNGKLVILTGNGTVIEYASGSLDALIDSGKLKIHASRYRITT